MKFGKRLQRLLDGSLPDWRDKYISYKQLKQSLKLISPADDANPLCFSHYCFCDGQGSRDNSCTCTPMASIRSLKELGSLFCRDLTPPEAIFITLLFSELDKVNTFFVEKEEEFVIRTQETKGEFERLLETCGGNLELSHEIIDIRKAIVNIHREMVVLENYSALNYTGLVKILKKHDKRTGGVLQTPFVESALQEPFFAMDIMSKLVQECEEMLQFLSPIPVLMFEEA